MIRLIQKADLDEFAKIYKELYDNANIGNGEVKVDFIYKENKIGKK